MFAVLRKACEELNARLAFISVFQDIKEALASALFDINLKQKVTHPRTVAGCIMCRVEKGETGVNDKPRKHRMLNFIHLPMKMEPIVSSETSAVRTETPGNYPKRNNLHLEHGESLRTRSNVKISRNLTSYFKSLRWVTGLYLGKDSDCPNLNIVWFYSVPQGRIRDSVF